MFKSKKITIILCSILLAFLAFFGFFLANKNDSVVKADTIDTNYQFNTSGLYIPYSNFTAENKNSYVASETGYNGFVKIRFFFGYADNGIPRSTISTAGNTNNEFLPSSPGNNIYIRYDSSATPYVTNYINFSPYSGGNWSEHYGYMLNNQTYYPYTYNLSSSDFNYNIVSCRIYSVKDGYWSVSNLGQYFFVFTDVNGNSLSVDFTCYGGRLRDNMMLEDRTYYYTSSFTDNQYFQAGLQEGLNRAQPNIYDEGYNKAIEENKSDWEQTGYNRGVQDANDYTFLGLIGATIDAPITALFGRLDTNPESSTYNQYVGGFFNFDLLGVNLRSFFFAILTFALIIVIVRFALAR